MDKQLLSFLFLPDVTDEEEKSKMDAGKWWKPWVSTPGGAYRTIFGGLRYVERFHQSVLR